MKDNPTFIKERVNMLESLKLRNLDLEEIRKQLFESLIISYHIFPQVPGA